MSIARMFAADAMKQRKSYESLIGICSGILADGDINASEVKFLHQWLLDNKEVSDIWPGDVISSKVKTILSDGCISQEELSHLKDTLSQLIGGTIYETGATSGISTSLPLNDDIAGDILLNERKFCFTGEFVIGPRSVCTRKANAKGAKSADTITLDLDYLVIGTMVSKEWANSTFGRKIEKAVEYQKRGSKLLIISEKHWIKYV